MFVVFIDQIFYYKYVLMIANGFIWIPQIIKNAVMKARNVPDAKFIFSMTLTQCSLPLYLNGYSDNEFLSEIDYEWTLIFLVIVGGQVCILLMQQKLGARFFLPAMIKNWGQYNYYYNLEEGQTEEAEIECCICLNPLSCSPDDTNSVRYSIIIHFIV